MISDAFNGEDKRIRNSSNSRPGHPDADAKEACIINPFMLRLGAILLITLLNFVYFFQQECLSVVSDRLVHVFVLLLEFKWASNAICSNPAKFWTVGTMGRINWFE